MEFMISYQIMQKKKQTKKNPTGGSREGGRKKGRGLWRLQPLTYFNFEKKNHENVRKNSKIKRKGGKRV